MRSFIAALPSTMAGVVLTVGTLAAAPAFAAGVYTVNTAPLDATPVTFQADFLQGNSSTLITANDSFGNTATGVGYTAFTGFALLGNPVNGTGLNNDYQLWIEYTYTLSRDFGTFGQPGSQYTVTSLNIDFFGAAGTAVTFTQATVGNNPTVNLNTATAILLGQATGISGTALVNSQGGAGFNAVAAYLNTPVGNNFFIDPVPFYNLVFAESNNTSNGVILNFPSLVVNQASTGVDFVQVPEPGTLALLGVALAAVGATSRRRKQ